MSTKRFMIRKLFLPCIFSIFSITCSGQLPRIETKEEAFASLTQQLSDSNRQYIFNFLGKLYMINATHDQKIIDSTFYYLRKAVYLGDSLNRNNKEITNESLCLLAKAYIWNRNASIAKKIFLQVIGNYRLQHQKTREAKTWRRMGKDFWYSDLSSPEITAYFDSAIALLEQEKNVLEKAEVMFDKMNFFSSTNNQVRSEEILQELIKMARSDRFQYGSPIYFMLAKQNRYTGNLNKGLEYALESVKYINYLKDRSGVAYYYGELAQIYEELGEAEQSIYWYKKCIAAREHGETSRYVLYRTVSLMVVQMIKAKKENEAILLLQQLSTRKPPATHTQKAVLAQSFGCCYAALKNYKLAEPKFLEMISEYDQSETQQEILFIAHYDITRFYVDFHQYAKARLYLDKIPLGGASLPQNRDLYLLMFKIDSANGKMLSAIQHYQKYKALNDTVFNEVKSRQINELMVKYESEKKDNNIKTLESETMAQHKTLTQANQIRNWILGVAILLLVITALLINTGRIRQQANKKLQQQQKEIQIKNISLQHLVKEKDWLVKEIHHRVKNNFHMVMGLLATQAEYLKTEEAINAMTESRNRIQAMSLIHQKLYQSDDLSAINMSDYIHELVTYLRNSFNIRQSIQFQLNIDPIALNLSYCIPLGLIMNEAITNAIKYAFPDNKEGIINISFLHLAGDHLSLMIRDNGIGLPLHFDAANTGSMGMKLMKGLSEDIDGHFTIASNNGTELILELIYHTDGSAEINKADQSTNSI